VLLKIYALTKFVLDSGPMYTSNYSLKNANTFLYLYSVVFCCAY